jgi:hypothetical protein
METNDADALVETNARARVEQVCGVTGASRKSDRRRDGARRRAALALAGRQSPHTLGIGFPRGDVDTTTDS